MRFAWLFASVFLTGCYLSHELGGGDAGPLPDVPCIPTGGGPRPVDVLLVVDDSPSMVEEQAQLATEIPHFVTALATGDVDGDGVREFEPITDMHVGAITVDMGVGGIPNIPTCMVSPDFGDDGVLLTMPRVGGPGCLATYPTFLGFTAGTDPAAFAASITCVARTGSSGCGFEQQLDAMLKALLPSSSPVRFAEGTHGHGDDTNAGFLRPGSVIAVLMITDEDDCSTNDVDIWNPLSAGHTGDLNLRCINYASELYLISRFVTGLHSLRPAAPSDVVLLAITGVPVDLVSGTTVDYDALFADERMHNHVTITGATSNLDAVCSAPGRGIATPAVRIASVARGLGESGLVQSICAPSYDQSLSWLASFAGRRACAAP